MDVELAVRVKRKQGDAAMVMALEAISHVDEINLVLGHLALLNHDFSDAEAKFLQSSQQIKALEMRRDLMHWDRALQLAQTLDPSKIPLISREYAEKLELKGEYPRALELYQQGMSKPSSIHYQTCLEGYARVTIRCGNMREGFKLAKESGNKKLCKECATAFEELKQYDDAASLYESAEMFEKAAEIYITSKKYDKVTALISKIKNPKLHGQLARAKENEGKLQEAAKSYEDAGDIMNVVRLNLQLNNTTRAIDIVKRTKSTDGAAMIAKYCLEKKNYKKAIEFLILAENNDEAFDVAQAHDEMATYATSVGDNGTGDEYLSIAHFYETKGEFGRAADYYVKVHEHDKALKLYLRSGEENIGKAIDVVGIADNNALTSTLIDFLMGDTDGVPKDARHIFKLYMALGNFKQAAKTASLIAKQEQDLGNYLAAHNVLFDIIGQLEQRNIHVPADLRHALMLVHSYIIIKDLTATKDAILPARMLVRIAKNISKFPPNASVKILTSTVLQCIKAGLKKQAFDYASVLCREEYRNKIDEKYKKTIIGLVRKKKENDEVEEPLTPCPNCNTKIPETQLECDECKNRKFNYLYVTIRFTILYCIRTSLGT
jgi:WD repeat-containing protein 19